eukprot:11531156-Alexandrium_andersonii.AAC.1
MDRPGPTSTASIEAENHSAGRNPGGRKEAVHAHLWVALVRRRVLPPPGSRQGRHPWPGGARDAGPRG